MLLACALLFCAAAEAVWSCTDLNYQDITQMNTEVRTGAVLGEISALTAKNVATNLKMVQSCYAVSCGPGSG